MGKPEGNKSLGTLRLRWEDNIKLYINKIGWKSVGWIYLELERNRWRAVVNAAMNFRFPQKAESLLAYGGTVSSCKRRCC